jgi:hypothetical protein
MQRFPDSGVDSQWRPRKEEKLLRSCRGPIERCHCAPPLHHVEYGYEAKQIRVMGLQE